MFMPHLDLGDEIIQECGPGVGGGCALLVEDAELLVVGVVQSKVDFLVVAYLVA